MNNFNIISSSSKGNCIIINDNFMLDVGVSYKKIEQYLKDVKIIFIDHIHTDHFKFSTVKKIAYEYPNIKFIVGFYLIDKLIECGVQQKNIYVLDLDKWYDIGIAKVQLNMLIHDVPNCSIKIEFKDGYKVFYATDTSSIDHIECKDYNLYLLESNYLTDEEIEKKIKEADEKGEYCYLKRVLHTHLSQLQAINWLQDNMGKDSIYHFIHQHIEKGNLENEKN